jgi:hypothetical protein
MGTADIPMTQESSNFEITNDNAPVHKALSVKQFLDQKFITEMEHPP